MVHSSKPSDGRIGPYRLIKRLAVGGMADIHLAQQYGRRGYERTVVLKTIRADLVEEEELIQLLLEEARIASCLKHDNIVELVEVGNDGGTHYLVMEFVFGRDLAQIRDRCEELGTGFPDQHVATVTGAVLEALHHAHHEARLDGAPISVIHRDVSPQNILVGFDGTVKLLDFGLAKTTAQISRTHAGVLKGKYAYMSPEQVNFREVDARSDIFSTGVVLWEMLARRRLFFRQSDYETVQAVMSCLVPFPRVVRPGALWAQSWVAYRALRRNPRWRYQSARKMRAALLRDAGLRAAKETQDALAEWMGRLFERELAARDLALARARQDPTRHRQILDAGFELLEETTDPDLRLRPRERLETLTPAPTRIQPADGWVGLATLILGPWRWFALVLAAVMFLGVAAGIYIDAARVAARAPHGYLHVFADTPHVSVVVGTTRVGEAPVQRIAVIPGRHRVTGARGDARRTVEVNVAAGENKVVKLEFGRR